MSFSYEYQMIPVIKSNLRNFSNDNKNTSLVIAEELPVNYRIIDLVVANMMEIPDVIKNTYDRIFRRLSMVELDVLSIFLHTEFVTIHHLSKCLMLEPDTIKEVYLNKFIDMNLIIKTSRYSYKTTEWSKIKPMSLTAIEAKLSKWSEALKQAEDNLNFADYSYVALPSQKILKQQILESFKQSNVGLISVDDYGTMRVILKANRNRKYNASDFKFQRLRLIRDLICGNSKWYQL